MNSVGPAAARIMMPVRTHMPTESAKMTPRAGSRRRDEISCVLSKPVIRREAVMMWNTLRPVVCVVLRACAIIAWTALQRLCPRNKEAFKEAVLRANPGDHELHGQLVRLVNALWGNTGDRLRKQLVVASIEKLLGDGPPTTPEELETAVLARGALETLSNQRFSGRAPRYEDLFGLQVAQAANPGGHELATDLSADEVELFWVTWQQLFGPGPPENDGEWREGTEELRGLKDLLTHLSTADYAACILRCKIQPLLGANHNALINAVLDEVINDLLTSSDLTARICSSFVLCHWVYSIGLLDDRNAQFPQMQNEIEARFWGVHWEIRHAGRPRRRVRENMSALASVIVSWFDFYWRRNGEALVARHGSPPGPVPPPAAPPPAGPSPHAAPRGPAPPPATPAPLGPPIQPAPPGPTPPAAPAQRLLAIRARFIAQLDAAGESEPRKAVFLDMFDLLCRNGKPLDDDEIRDIAERHGVLDPPDDLRSDFRNYLDACLQGDEELHA